MKLQELYDGWKNHLIPDKELTPHIDRVHTARMNICNTCEWHSKNHETPSRPDDHCFKCKCTLVAKTKCLICACPEGFWDKAVNE